MNVFLIKIQIFLYIIFTSIFLRILSYQQLNKFIKVSPFFMSRSNLCQNEYSKIVERLSKKINVNKCFVKSIVLFKALKKNGFCPRLIVGGRFVDSIYHSHSWVELKEQNLIYQNKDDFKEVIRYT
tara:strand:+ start:3465 stop:3842 length:378 start_codon:yes stop_codon:yes gene_type:complete